MLRDFILCSVCLSKLYQPIIIMTIFSRNQQNHSHSGHYDCPKCCQQYLLLPLPSVSQNCGILALEEVKSVRLYDWSHLLNDLHAGIILGMEFHFPYRSFSQENAVGRRVRISIKWRVALYIIHTFWQSYSRGFKLNV